MVLDASARNRRNAVISSTRVQRFGSARVIRRRCTPVCLEHFFHQVTMRACYRGVNISDGTVRRKGARSKEKSLVVRLVLRKKLSHA